MFLIYNSLILFSDKISVQLSSYISYIFSCSKKSFSSQQKHFNVNYSHTRVLCLFFICTSYCQETKSNTCNQIGVLLQRDLRLKVLKNTVLKHNYGFLSTKTCTTYLICCKMLMVIFNSFSWNECWGYKFTWWLVIRLFSSVELS